MKTATTIPLNKELHQFDPDHFGTLDGLRASAEIGQREILLIACSDHGTAPDHLSCADAGALIIVQNMATSIPAKDHSHGLSTLANLEYAILLHQARHVVVCHHLNCGIIPHWMMSHGGDETNHDAAEFDRQTKMVVEECYSDLAACERTEIMIREHTLFQLENLLSHEFVHKRLHDGQLHLHAWVVDDDTARVEAYEPTSGQFRNLR